MKGRFLFGVVIASVAGLAMAGMKNEPDGFRNITWGTDFSTVAADMTLDEDGGSTKFYARKGDSMQIGGAELASLVYGFTDNKFHHVFIKTKGISNRIAIVDAFNAQFGTPVKPNRFIDRYYWSGPVAKVIVSCNSISEECNVILSSVALDRQEEEKKKAAAAGAAKDF